MAPQCIACLDNLSARSSDFSQEDIVFLSITEPSEVASKKAQKMFPEPFMNIISSEDSAEAYPELLKVRSHSFNIFNLAKATPQPLKFLFLATVQDFDLINKLQLPKDKLERLADDLQDAYNQNSYHGAVHAADMTQMAACILHKDGLGAALSPLMLFGVLLAAAGHDAAHTGIKNDAVAIKAAGLTKVFGVAGSQEHMHAKVTCALLLNSGLLEGRNADVAAVNFVICQLILATDMSRHNEVNAYGVCSEVSEAVATQGLQYSKWGPTAQLKLCCLMLHWADLSNAARAFDIAAAFAVLLGHEQSPAGAAKGTAAAAAAAATATAAVAYAVAGDAAQAAAGAAIAAAVIAASRSSQVSEQQMTLEELVQEQEVAAVAKAQIGFMVHFAASTLSSIKALLPNAAAEAQQHFDSNLARWQSIVNNSSSSSSTAAS